MAVPVKEGHQTVAESVEDIEMELLLQGVFQLLGNDFRHYERTNVQKNLRLFMQENDIETVSCLQNRVFHTPGLADDLLRILTIKNSEFFDDAFFIRFLRDLIGPFLKSYPNPRIWLAESTTCEEIFTFAVLLEELDIYDKTQIYVTCSSEALIQSVREGSFDLSCMPKYEENYKKAGGKGKLSEYCTIQSGRAHFHSTLGRNVVWSHYNLATDASFNEFQLIVCRHQLVQFNAVLRQRALKLFGKSLGHLGILCTDTLDDFNEFPFSSIYKALSHQHGIYQCVDINNLRFDDMKEG